MITQHHRPELNQQLHSVDNLPNKLKEQLARMILDKNFNGYFNPTQVEQLTVQQPSIDQLLRDLVPLAQTYSLAPISNFHVGAVALGASGGIYLGANIEFLGQTLGQTVHAEQCVITNAWNHGEQYLNKLAVSATPCGHCRQFINELHHAAAIEVLLPDQPSITFKQLLPLSFGPDDLNVSDRLMQSSENHIPLVSTDHVALAAIKAARISYSPYSQSPSGVAIATSHGLYSGRYAENCAYNPSLSPIQGALISLHLSGEHFSDIEQVVLVEQKNSMVSQHHATKQLLSLFDAKFTYLTY